MKKRLLYFFIFVVICIAVIIGYFNRISIKDWWQEKNKESVPAAINYEKIKSNSSAAIDESSSGDSLSLHVNKEPESPDEGTVASPDEGDIKIADSINLNVPFQPQAPFANWGHPYQEACEEASIILTVKYLEGVNSISSSEMNNEILEMVSWQKENWGGHYDLTAEETKKLIEKYFNNKYKVEITENFTWKDVKKSLAQGYPVIVPAAGRQIGNPYYTQPGPLYHMLVIKGYTENNVITNDPGTKRGADYQYKYDALYNAIHDWNEGDVDNGKKVMLVIKPAD